jgi:hypothetical protein
MLPNECTVIGCDAASIANASTLRREVVPASNAISSAA